MPRGSDNVKNPRAPVAFVASSVRRSETANEAMWVQVWTHG